MKKILILLCALLLISCTEKEKTALLNTKWVVKDLIVDGQKITKTNDVFLEVKNEGVFNLKLDANKCFGNYTITENKNIKIGNIACTEMCCDSDYSKAVVNALSKINTIDYKNERLVLNGKNNTSISFINHKDEIKQPIKTNSNPGPKREYLSITKTECFGKCPAYTMNIYPDGSIEYTGVRFVNKVGKHNFKVQKNKVAHLFKQAREIGFDKFKSSYDDTKIADLPSTILSYNNKKIVLRYNYPKTLKALENNIHQFAESTGFITKHAQKQQ